MLWWWGQNFRKKMINCKFKGCYAYFLENIEKVQQFFWFVLLNHIVVCPLKVVWCHFNERGFFLVNFAPSIFTFFSNFTLKIFRVQYSSKIFFLNRRTPEALLKNAITYGEIWSRKIWGTMKNGLFFDILDPILGGSRNPLIQILYFFVKRPGAL